MNSTPEINNVHMVKLSPFGSAINKSLLTPCRRVGLSRKRKTPSSIVKICSEDLGSSNITDVSSSANTTPVNYRKSFVRQKSNNSKLLRKDILESNENILLDESKPKLFIKKITSEDLFNSDEDSSFIRECEDFVNIDKNILNECSSNSQKKPKLDLKNKSDVSKKPKSSENLVINDKLEQPVRTSDFLNSTDSTLNSNPYIPKYNSELDEDFIIFNKNIPKQKPENDIKCKTKNISSPENNLRSGILSNANCKVIIEKLPKRENLHKSVSISDDEMDAFTSTPKQEKVDKKNLKKKVKTLEYEIKKKKEKLENLKQASIYQSKHNIEELNQLTSKWMDGCVLGMNNLLSLLQDHGPMDMSTLVNNLHIPKEVAVKLKLIN